MRYPSKVDGWLAVLVGGSGIALAVASIDLMLRYGPGHPAAWPLLAATLFYAAVLLLLAYPISYTLGPEALRIKSGLLFFQTIPLNAIRRVTASRSPLSAPAWSLQRLRIDYRHKGIPRHQLISPRERGRFLAELKGYIGDERVEAN